MELFLLAGCYEYEQTLEMKIVFDPHPVASATPLSPIGRGVGGEGLFSREKNYL